MEINNLIKVYRKYKLRTSCTLAIMTNVYGLWDCEYTFACVWNVERRTA